MAEKFYREYEVTGFRAAFAAGTIIYLTKEQAEPRKHNLRAAPKKFWMAKGDRRVACEVTKEIEFRATEVVGLVEDPSLVALQFLKAVEGEKPAASGGGAGAGETGAGPKPDGSKPQGTEDGKPGPEGSGPGGSSTGAGADPNTGA